MTGVLYDTIAEWIREYKKHNAAFFPEKVKLLPDDLIEDLHNHTSFSDGVCRPEEKIEAAIKNHVAAIGITDHFNTSKCPSIKPNKLVEYIAHINRLKPVYASKIRILTGLEVQIDHFPDIVSDLDFEATANLDFLLLEYIERFPKNASTADLEAFIKKIKCPVGLAHTDAADLVPRNPALAPTARFIDFMRRNGLFWEFNPGIRNSGIFDAYLTHADHPHVEEFFRLIAESGVRASTGSDTHALNPGENGYEYDLLNIIKADKILERFGIVKIKL